MKNGHDYQLLSKLYLEYKSSPFITPLRIELLKSIAQCGSISAGAKAIHKSYKWAWDSVDQMNQFASQTLVTTSSGGKGGGGATITPFAEELLLYYNDLEQIHQRKIEHYEESFERAFEQHTFSREIASILQGNIANIFYRAKYGEVTIDYAGTLLKAHLPFGMVLTQNSPVSFAVESNQIIIATQAVNISAQNLLIGQLKRVVKENNSVYLSLELITQEVLTVLITEDALEQLDLKVGAQCFAYFKTNTITIFGERP